MVILGNSNAFNGVLTTSFYYYNLSSISDSEYETIINDDIIDEGEGEEEGKENEEENEKEEEKEKEEEEENEEEEEKKDNKDEEEEKEEGENDTMELYIGKTFCNW